MVQMDLSDRLLRREIQNRQRSCVLTGDGDRPKLSSFLNDYPLTSNFLTGDRYIPDIEANGASASLSVRAAQEVTDLDAAGGRSRFYSDMAQDLEDECDNLFRRISHSRGGTFGSYASAPSSPSRSPDLFRKSKTQLSDHNCLMHPNHLSILQKLEASKYTILQLEDALARAEDQHQGLDHNQIEKFQQLAKKIVILEKEVELGRQEHELDSKTIASLKSDMTDKLQLLQKQKETATKEKENIVMRFAVSEKELLDQKMEKEQLNKKFKEAMKENENLLGKLKNLSAEKAKISQQLDSKSAELTNLYTEVDRLKEDINARDIKIKWTQNKLKSQMEITQKANEAPEQIEKLNSKILSLQSDIYGLKDENEDLKEQLKTVEHGRITEQKYKEQKAQLITSTHEYKELESKYKLLNQKLDQLMEENSMLALETQELNQERFDLSEKLKMVVDQNAKLSNAIVELEERLGQMDSLKKDLKKTKEASRQYAAELESLRKANEELEADMEQCRNRESELLEFTQRVTDKNVSLQSEFTSVEEKACELEKEEEEHGAVLKLLKSEVSRLEAELTAEKERRSDEAKLLARQVAEKSSKMNTLESSLTEAQSELTLLKNKYSVALKELQKELQHYRKRVEQLESSGGGSSGSDSMCQESRTSSLSSLNDNGNQSSPFQVLDVPAQILVERIVKLQHDNAKHAERVEFLEEHSVHLVRELQKKSKLLQNYILREQTGALTSKSMDTNKAEFKKHGGIMASIYSAKPVDESMSLELCMEINQKLQAVLEDTLLKNITLKENIDTLGDEIARLSEQKS